MSRNTLALLLAAAVIWAATSVHADPQPAIDRQLMERLIRAEEAQTHALEGIERALQSCRR